MEKMWNRQRWFGIFLSDMKRKLIQIGGLELATFLWSCSDKPTADGGGDSSGANRVVSGITPETSLSKDLEGIAEVYQDGAYTSTQVRNAEKYIVYVTASW